MRKSQIKRKAKKPYRVRRSTSPGWIRRWNWRTQQRVGPGHDKVGGREMRRLLRTFSWRRAL